MEPGEYLFTNAGFSRENKPVLTFQDKGGAHHAPTLFGSPLSLSFDTSQRYCRGWHNLETGENFACPDSQAIVKNYDQCAACQKRTGFNPAFYNTSEVSPQQEARNKQPHILYLAHFAPGVLKVGISFAGRGISRLLEQGARSALVLATLSTAHEARAYEARIARLPGIAETIQLRKKISLLGTDYLADQAREELGQALHTIETALETPFETSEFYFLDPFYFPDTAPNMSQLYDTSEHAAVSGDVIGMLGTCLVCHQQDTPLFVPLKQFIGYRVRFDTQISNLTLAERQLSLF